MRRRLAAVALAVTSLVAVAFAIPLGLLIREVAQDRALTQAERDAAAVAPLLTLGIELDLVAAGIGSTTTGADGRLGVSLPDGRWVGGGTPLDPTVLALARGGQQSFSVRTGDGLDVIVPVVGGTGTSIIRAHVPSAALRQGVGQSWAALAAVAVVLVLSGVAVADTLARSVTRPATALATTARHLAKGDLEARADEAGPPELVEASRAFNHLASRISELLVAERERVADLSHRLRTPLTALRLVAESRGDDELRHDVDRMTEAVDRAIHDARRPLTATAPATEVVAVVRSRVDFWGALAEDQGRPWTFTVTGGDRAMVALDEGELAAALDALLGNIFAHTDEGTACAVTARLTGDVIVIDVEDAGRGIEEPTAVLGRGTSGGGSTGLGLDIARTVAEATGGSLAILPSTLGGTCVRVTLRTVPHRATGG